MGRIRFFTAGESHGRGIFAYLEGIPANLELKEEEINRELFRRQKGYGRGGRMLIERDKVDFLSGVRFGKTIGSPILMAVWNRDYENWREVMKPFGEPPKNYKPFTKPRPGHGDLAGGIKFFQRDLRNVLERASARETVGRVLAGSVCKQFLKKLGIVIGSYVISIGELSPPIKEGDLLKRFELAELSEVRFPDPSRDEEFKFYIDFAKERGESLGGSFEVFAIGLPPGFGSYTSWDLRLDGRIAQSIMSIQAIKAVEIGLGAKVSTLVGSKVHDQIAWSEERGFYRLSNNLGGTEAGVSNGMALLIRAHMKPIPTLKNPLQSVDIETKEVVKAGRERSDVVAVPSASVVAESMLAITLTDVILEKIGGDFMEEVLKRWREYLNYVKNF